MKGVTLKNLNQNLRSYTDQIVKPLIAKGGNSSGSSAGGISSKHGLVVNMPYELELVKVGATRDNNLPYSDTSREHLEYYFVKGEDPASKGAYYGTDSPNEDGHYTWNTPNFQGYHFGFVNKETGKAQMYVKTTDDLSKYEVSLLYSEEDDYYKTGWLGYTYPSNSPEWYDNIHQYTNELTVISDDIKSDLSVVICEGTSGVPTDSSEGKSNALFIIGEGGPEGSDLSSWMDRYDGFHVGFYNKVKNQILPWVYTKDIETYNYRVCIYYAEKADNKSSYGTNHFYTNGNNGNTAEEVTLVANNPKLHLVKVVCDLRDIV